jgi:hypothetical protein
MLANHRCTTSFTRDAVIVTLDGHIVLQGFRDRPTGLWTVPLGAIPQTNPTTTTRPPTSQEPILFQAANSAYHMKNKKDLATFYHAAAGYPVPSTWIQAIQAGNYATWPGLTDELISRNLPASIITSKGHMQQQRKNLRSTQPKPDPELAVEPTPKAEHKTHHVYAAITEASGRIDTDLTGRFPVTASTGNKYIFLLYDYDSNAIIIEPIRNRSNKEILRAYNKLHQYLIERGCRPLLQRLDNEASTALKRAIRDKDIDFQLVPPHMHRRLAAERAIQTFKNHLVAILCGTHPDFPLRLWDRLLPQAQLTLNLLRQSRINPRLSAQAFLNGPFDFNRTPLAPLGTKTLVHEKPKQRGTWASHGVEGWYINHAPEHYRCYEIYITATGGTRFADTVEFFPTHCPMPATSSADVAISAAQDLIQALQHPQPAAPFAPVGDTQLAALRTLAEIFATASQAPTQTPLNTPITTDSPSPRVQSPAPPDANSLRVPSPAPPDAHSPRVQHRYPTRGRPHIANQAQLVGVSNTSVIPSLVQPDNQPSADGFHPPLANAVLDPDTGESLEYKQLISRNKYKTIWTKSFANELGRLAQGIRDVEGTNTIFFIPKAQMPPGRTATYGRIVVEIKPQKTEKERTRLTVGGNLIHYPGDVSTKTAGLTTVKMLLNSVVSTPKAKFMCMDIKNFYLNTPLERFEYMRMNIALLPQEIIDKYNLLDIVDAKGWVYMEIRKGMYGLPQAGLLANQLLQKRMATHGYYQCKHTHGLWRHTTRPIVFSLVVDNFGVKYVGKEHANHLYACLLKHYPTSIDWPGKLYCGITLDWDYEARTVDLSMPGYVAAALFKFHHSKTARAAQAPSRYIPPNYGAKTQLVQHDTTALMTPDQTL